MWFVFLNINPSNAHPTYTIVGAFIEAIRLYVLGVFVGLRIKHIQGLATFIGLNHSVSKVGVNFSQKHNL